MIKIKNYKCFNHEFQGFEEIKKINVVIGRNNSGKSSLIDLVKFYMELAKKEKQGIPEGINIFTEFEVEKDYIELGFPKGLSNSKIGRFYDHGSKYISKKIGVNLENNGSRKVENIDFDYYKSHTYNLWSDYISRVKMPLERKIFKRIYAERDIKPEEDYAIEIDGNGNGITNIIQNYINKVNLNSEIIEKTFLEELNKIMNPDCYYTDIVVQQLSDKNWEIFLEEKGKGRIAISKSGSGLKTIIMVLVYLILLPKHEKKNISSYVFAFEELENNLHPALQRRLFDYILNIAKNEGITFFLTTHSNVVIDIFSQDEDSQISLITHNNNISEVKTIKSITDQIDIMSELGIKASDILQSNGIVWVEGPSDRIYFNKWIELFSEGKIKEGTHYQCLFYGGRLLSNLTVEENEKLINIFLTNRNTLMIIDSDKRSSKARINDTKKRIRKEYENINSFCWITKGKEIENYLPIKAIKKYYGKEKLNSFGEYELFNEYLEKIKKGEGTKFTRSKVKFAEEVTKEFNVENLSNILDLKINIEKCIKEIRKWNFL